MAGMSPPLLTCGKHSSPRNLLRDHSSRRITDPGHQEISNVIVILWNAINVTECRFSNTTSDRQQNSDNKPPPKCFTCGVVGHKSPDCPTRIMLKREPEDKKDKKKTLHTNRVSLSEEDLVENEIRATVADLEIPLLLDTGA